MTISAVSGTSAGALNAVALASGLADGGRVGAQQRLARVWTEVGRIGTWISSPLEAVLADTPLQPWVQMSQAWARMWTGPVGGAWQQAVRMWGAAWSAGFSPYDINPWGVHPLRRIIQREIDFDAMRRGEVEVYVSATAVRSGRLRVFDGSRIDVDVVLASACLPTLFQAVTIDGEEYWDGGYAGNPSLLPLVDHAEARDLLVVQINPVGRDEAPTTAPDILDRMNEITFNASLVKELRILGLLQIVAPEADRACEQHPFLARVRDLRAHRIDGGDELARFSASSKTEAPAALIRSLHDLGWQQADAWLVEHRADLGRRQTLDLASLAIA
ncbi:patatin-like phospholipase family protein [Mobilicoccus caccae]|uniref:patatin-like phospholipase family protein n=1 Tax=Mobilicoccus caccae TaxID=1859295 RepID=UPI0024E0806D|nr:patatin-like phospholipase family protein [Mobilicoccus caccae]